MTERKPGFLAQLRSYPTQFWVANTMEIFERMSWYGWFTVMSLYVTGSVETGGLGFSTEDRGALMAIVPFFVYIFPVFTGALADRYGFRKTFIAAYVVMVISYYMLGQFTTFPTFFLAFMFVAAGAALFKPVVVGTVAKMTDESNSATGFGIFYMMINVGGFLGPIVAGIVRGWGWSWVFVACSAWALVNLIIVLTLYREPPTEQGQRAGSFRKVLDNMVEALGNLRFFVMVFGVLLALMAANLRVGIFQHFLWWPHCILFLVAWIVLNFVWDGLLPRGSGRAEADGATRRNPLMRRMHCSNWRFALFLLILSGFWTSYHQVFLTMPEYIRDFTDTRPMIRSIQSLFGDEGSEDPGVGVASRIATINPEEREEIANHVRPLVAAWFGEDGTLAADGPGAAALEESSRELLHSKVRVAPDRLEELILASGGDVDRLTDRVIVEARQINPEFIINIGAGSIVLFQVLVSFLMARFHRFTTMIAGMVIAAVGLGLSAFAGGAGMVGVGSSIWIVASGLFIISIGEMMASPTSQEYVGRVAPADKKALYMGYYFVAMALGYIFGGVLSGELYGALARDMQRPDLMWLAFGGIMLLSAALFLLYDRFALPRNSSHELTPGG